MDDINTIVFMIGMLLAIFVLAYILLTRRMDELQHDLEQLKLDTKSNAYGLRTVTCAVVELEKRMEDEPSHENKRMAASPERREAGGRNDPGQPV